MNKKLETGLWVLLAVGLLALLRHVVGRLCLLLLVSATLAYLIFPLGKLFSRLGRTGSTALAFLTVALALSLVITFGIPALIRQVVGLGDSIPYLVESLGNLLAFLREKLSGAGLPEETLVQLQSQAGLLLTQAAAVAAQTLMRLAKSISGMGYLILSPVLAFYMLRDRERLFDTLQRFIPSRWRPQILEMGISIRDAIGSYVRGQLTVSLITGTITAVGLLIIGLPSWLVMGALMVIFNLIPTFGPLLGAIPVVVFSAANGLPMVLGGIAVILIAQQMESLVVAPRIIGQVAALHPGIVMLALLAGGWIGGLPGLFFSIPAVLTMRAVMATLQQTRLQGLAKKV